MATIMDNPNREKTNSGSDNTVLLERGNGLRRGNQEEENDSVNAGCGGDLDCRTLFDCLSRLQTVESVNCHDSRLSSRLLNP